MPAAPDFLPVPLAVVTVSDTRTLETDKSGGLCVEKLTAAGHRVVRRHLVPDDREGLTALFRSLVEDPAVRVVIATGGTGFAPRDVTPEALEPLVTKPMPGFGEVFRHLSWAEIGTSTLQSRATAALCGDTLVFLLPGSTGAVRLALDALLLPQLDARTKPCNFVELLGLGG